MCWRLCGLIAVAVVCETVAVAETGPASFVYKTIGDRQLTMDVNYPPEWKAADKRPAIVFFSGGAFRSGGTKQFRSQAAYFAARGMIALRAEYRDSTRDKVGSDVCLKDAVSALRWTRAHAAELGIDPNRIVAAGGSAGGYLAAAAATVRDYHDDTDDLAVSPLPNALVLFNPVVDLGRSVDRRDRREDDAKPREESRSRDEGRSRRPHSPLDSLTAELPPTVILIGSKDTYLEQVQEFVKKAEGLKARCELEVFLDQTHAFFNKSPFLGKTAGRADAFLQSLGYLGPEPRVELPEPIAED
jgi:acetyl esterase